MSDNPINTRSVGTRRASRLGALALAVLMGLTACATGVPMGGRSGTTLRGTARIWSTGY